MRIRSLIAAGTLAVVALAVSAPPASADPGKAKGKELVECVEKALSSNHAQIEKQSYESFTNALDDCRAAKSLILPEASEILWSGLAFIIVAVLLMKFGFPAIRQ